MLLWNLGARAEIPSLQMRIGGCLCMEMRRLETERRRGSPWESRVLGPGECGLMADWCAGWPSSDKQIRLRPAVSHAHHAHPALPSRLPTSSRSPPNPHALLPMPPTQLNNLPHQRQCLFLFSPGIPNTRQMLHFLSAYGCVSPPPPP